MKLKRILPILFIFLLQFPTVLGNVVDGGGTGYSIWYNDYHKFCIGKCHYLCDTAFNIHNMEMGINEIIFLSLPIILFGAFLFLIIYTVKNKKLVKKQKNINITISIVCLIFIIFLILFILLTSPFEIFGDSFWYCCHDRHY